MNNIKTNKNTVSGSVKHISIPEKLNELAGYSQKCSCGRVHSVDTKLFVIEHHALDQIPDVIKKYAATVKTAGILSDQITREIAGNTISKLLKKEGLNIEELTLKSPPGARTVERPHATFENTLFVEEQLKHCQIIIAVGSGTINDLAKLASFRIGIPYITVPTAASMNGYTSAIAAIMKNGLKQTIDCHQPLAVIADISIISKAPVHLNASGLGDLESKPVSTSDFKLSSLITNSYFCAAPGELVAKAEKKAAQSADGLAKGNEDAVKNLMEALLLSGCSMKLASSSSPASGGEHLISHLFDMTAEQENRVEGWHGAQVGVATIVTATLYEELKKVDPSTINIQSLLDKRVTLQQHKDEITKNHGSFAEQVFMEFSKKYPADTDYKKRLEFITHNWNTIWENINSLKSPSEIKSILKAAGAPVTMKELGLTPAHLHYSFLHAREIRGRYTVLDFAADIGMLQSLKDKILNKSGCLD
ncbi:MAG: iron-containing alcohol dehydrogenase [Deltaproteobacteria bacterium]|nr:iron-containing alcohol dehydrogenase [Deltaproteobacteria bacterium]